MKTRLDQLTVNELVQLLEGDYSVLHERGDISEKITGRSEIASRLIDEYNAVSDPAAHKASLRRAEEFLHSRMEVVIFSMLDNLCKVKEYSRVREVLVELDIPTERMSDSRVVAEVSSRLARARKAVEDTVDEPAKGGDSSGVRKRFDKQTAVLMSYFKFQIDPSTMSASIYANLINQMDKELKAKIAAMKKK